MKTIQKIASFTMALAVLAGCTAPLQTGDHGDENVASYGEQTSAEATANTPSVAVPAEYRQLYDSLSGKLDAFDRALEKQCAGVNGQITFAAELLGAHVSEQLFNQEYYKGQIDYLNGLKSMGVQGVKIAISYPQLNDDFPDRDKYVAVYKNMIKECRARGLKVLISSGNYFGPPFTTIKYSFAGLTLDKYRQGKRATAEMILNEFQPDYLSVANEPTTENMLLGINQTSAQYADTTRYILDGLNKNGALVGSGAGSWSNLSYIRELCKIPELDYIDIHIYPVDYLQGAVDAAAIARGAGKRVIMGEMGLYKVKDEEMGDLGKLATQAAIFQRDVFSFWEPLDSRWLKTVVKMSKCCGYEFISVFWSTLLFGYVEYSDINRGLGYTQLRQINNRIAYSNLKTGKLSGWGETYRDLIKAR